MTTTASGADSRNERNLASADRAAAGSVDGAVGERVGFMAARSMRSLTFTVVDG
jgi:hypothetical protein